MRRKRLSALTRKSMLPAVSILVVVSFGFLLFGWRLGSLPPAFSPEEKLAVTASSSAKIIVNNPLNAPHKIPQFVIQKTIGVSTLSMRAVSVFFALVAIVCFYLIIKWWFKYDIAILGTILFASTPWVVINARSATPAIMFLGSLSVIAAYLWLQSTDKHHNLALILMGFLAATSLYLPGIFWLTIIGAIAAYRPIALAYKSAAKIVRYSLPVLMGLILTPLIYASVVDYKILRELLLVPSTLLNPLDSLIAIVWAGLGVVYRTRDTLPTTLGTLPVLDAFSVVLFIVGCFWLLTQVKRRRTYWLFISIAASLVIIGLNKKNLELLLILPAIFVIIAGGLNFLYKEWFRVFPRNPLAKWLGIGVIMLAICISVIYNVRYSLVAWPNSPETSSYYVIQ